MRLVAPGATLHTPRLALEPITVAHAAALYPALQDERLYTYIPQDPPRSLQELEARYRRLSYSARRPRPSGLGMNGALARRVVGCLHTAGPADIYACGCACTT